MIPLAGYANVRRLSASSRSQVYAAQRSSDGSMVVAKVFDIRDEAVRARVEHEFGLLQQLDLPEVVRPRGIERSGDQLVLLLDYIEGQNLAEFTRGRVVGLEEFISIATRLAASLAKIHALHVVHRDIKPSNILVEAGTQRLYIADFGISVLLENQRRLVHDPDIVAGTLPYISPEQTGRTRREVDVRSDLYSLGVSFYELLTGQRPFVGETPLQLIHAHLAQRPTPPRELRAELPAGLSAVIMKLLEKAPEHRYQSARGLLADLERFAAAQAAGQADPEFELGASDYSATLLMPHQLYGRERELHQLHESFTALRSNGGPGLLLVSGEPGQGKSALIRELEGPLSSEGGQLINVKFELDARETPYAALLAGLSRAFEQLLTRSEVELARWRQRLRRGLGSVAGVLVELIAPLGLVLGRVEVVPELELGESRNRLQLALERLLASIASAGPVVLVIDDLQWSDDASTQLLCSLLGRSALGPVLFVLAYRRGEIRADHACLVRARELEATTIELAPLEREAVEHMLVDLLGQAREQLAPLVELISRKTDNNPLFVRQFLVHLGELGLLRPSPSGWSWDLEAIAQARIPDDILGVLASKLERLGPRLRRLLVWGACQGAQFELAQLEFVARELEGDAERGLSRAQIVAGLYELESEGLIVTRDACSFAFAHDRLQEAALVEFDADQRAQIHACLARGLLDAQARGGGGGGVSAKEELVFALVEQLEPALAALGLEALLERVGLHIEALLERFAAAGQRALDTGGWLSARRYYERGVELVESATAQACIDRGGELYFSLYFGRALAIGLSGDVEAEAEAFEELDALDLPSRARARIAARRAEILALQRRNAAAFKLVCAALRELGVEIPARIAPLRVLAAATHTQLRLRNIDLDALMQLPKIDDEDTLSLVHLLVPAARTSFAVSSMHFAWLLALQTRLMLRVGYHPGLIDAFAQYAFIASRLFGVEAGVRLGELAQAFAEARDIAPQALSRVRSAYLIMTAPQHRPFAELGEEHMQLLRYALEVGDHLNAGQGFGPSMGYRLSSGMHLRELIEIGARVAPGMPGAGQLGLDQDPAVLIVLRFAQTLSSREQPPTPGFYVLPGKASRVERAAQCTYEALGWALLGDYARAFAVCEPIAERYERDSNGMWLCIDYAAVSSVAAAERCVRGASRQLRRRLRRRLRARLKTARRWAEGCRANYGPIAELIAAELARIEARPLRALNHYEQSRALAAEVGMHHYEGLACERLAELAAAQGWLTVARAVRLAARRAYSRWGAHAVVARFDQAFPEIRELDATMTLTTLSSTTASASRAPSGVPASVVSHSSSQVGSISQASVSASGSRSDTGHVLDLESLFATSRALSEELRLEEVIRRVLASAIENAGADRGLALLERGGELALVAEGDTVESRDYVEQPIPLSRAGAHLACSVVRYVSRTGDAVVLDDAREDSRFCTDPYIVRSGVPSLLCTPLRHHGELVAIVMLENHLGPRAFTRKRVEVLDMVLSQAGNALQNARLFARLELSEQRWRTLANGVPDLIVVLDRQGIVEITNEGMARLPDAGEALVSAGQELALALAPADRPRWAEVFARVLDSGEPGELELRVVLRPSQPRWAVARVTPLTTESERGRVLAVFTDIQDRRTAEEAKAALEAQLRQQQRLESIGTLASGVAHEINNPVQGIMNYAELLRAEKDDPQVVEEFAGEIVHEAERVTGIVRGLLTFARQESAATPEPTHPQRLVEASLLLLTTLLRKDGIALTTELEPELPHVECRPQQIQQIIMNLITNARDALVGAKLPRERMRLELRVKTRADRGVDWVRFSVRDQGTGIPVDARAQIFDPFFTTKGRDKGTGLGLAISHGIATEHRGHLSFETELGVGTSFHLDLPAARAPGER